MTLSTHHSTRPRDSNLELKLILAVGFLGLGVGLFAAASRPASGYEISIYRATPLLFWFGVSVALVTSLLLTFARGVPKRLYNSALVLAGVSIWSVLALPIIRDYFFYAGGDTLSHLGFARMFAEGSMSPVNLIHPGLHVTSLTASWATGLSLERSMVLTSTVFFAIYLVFVPLCVRAITNDDRAFAVGLFSAGLLLPINNVATHIVPHPSSQTILFAPLILFLLFAYLSRSNDGTFGRPRAVGVLLAVSSAAIVFFHPEQALNVLVIFGVGAFLGLVYRRVDPDHPFARHGRLYFQTALLATIVLLWAPRSPRTQSRFSTLMSSLQGSATPGGGDVAQRAVSLAAVGGSIEELFLKLFFVSLVFSALAALVMVSSVTGWLDDAFPRRNAYGKYLTAAFLPLLAATGVIFLAGFGDHYFRYIGFLMMLATILGAAALVRAIPVVVSRVSVPTLRKATIVLFVVLLPIAMLSIHPSPWIYHGSAQVTAPQYEGYRTAFEYRDPDVPYAGIRGGPWRYVESIYGPTSSTAQHFPGGDDWVPGSVLERNVTSYYDEPRYVPITEGKIWIEVVLYDEFRYSWQGFRVFENTPGVDRVQSNSGIQIYYVDGSG